MKRLTIILICFSAVAFGQDMQYKSQIEQISSTIENGDTINTITFSDTCLTIPIIHVISTDGSLGIKEITKYNCKVHAPDNTGRSFRIAICKED